MRAKITPFIINKKNPFIKQKKKKTQYNRLINQRSISIYKHIYVHLCLIFQAYIEKGALQKNKNCIIQPKIIKTLLERVSEILTNTKNPVRKKKKKKMFIQYRVTTEKKSINE